MSLRDQFIGLCRLHRGEPGLGAALYREFKGALPGKPVLIWLETNACSGDSISALNMTEPGLGQFICDMFEVVYWSMIMGDQGRSARDEFAAAVERGGFFLAVEGAIATAGGGRFAVPFISQTHSYTSLELIQAAAPRASGVVAVGTCAAFGGPSAARPNPSGSVGVWEVIDRDLVVNVSGCPVNPDWLTGTLMHLLLLGRPEVDRYQRPVLFYGQTIHSLCQRRSYFDQGQFAMAPGDPECMFMLGCMGPVTGADCPYRLWNDHLNWPVKASTPCIGCTKSGFPDKSTPFYRPLPAKMPIRRDADHVQP